MIGTEEVFFAVVATTLTLTAVFVPLSFLPGQSGGLFREFGFTLAIAVTLSAVVALTLCPVMAARLLQPAPSGRAPAAARRVGAGLRARLRAHAHGGARRRRSSVVALGAALRGDRG